MLGEFEELKPDSPDVRSERLKPWGWKSESQSYVRFKGQGERRRLSQVRVPTQVLGHTKQALYLLAIPHTNRLAFTLRVFKKKSSHSGM